MSLPKTIKYLLDPQMPKGKRLTPQNIYNIRMKISRLLPLMDKKTDYQTFQMLANTPKYGSNQLHADNIDVSPDEACKAATFLWKEVMNDNNRSKMDTLVCFTDYMERLKSEDPEFAYQILTDDTGEVTGCLWMTSTMRQNFESFGGFISVDAMKRDINTLLWPYIATTMYNEMDSICVGCEGIVLSEREEAYEAMLKFQIENSRRTRDEVYGIACDGFLNQSIINRFGFIKTKFIIDYWHLFKQVSNDQVMALLMTSFLMDVM